VVWLIELFEKYVDRKILAHFLNNPTTSFHVKNLIDRAEAEGALKAAKEFLEGIKKTIG